MIKSASLFNSFCMSILIIWSQLSIMHQKIFDIEVLNNSHDSSDLSSQREGKDRLDIGLTHYVCS